MKIVTVNVPESYIEAIERLIGNDGLYPSRSELIRCAVREFLLKELKMAKKFQQYTQEKTMDHPNDKNYVHIPIEKPDNGGAKEFKTYKIIRRLEF